MSQCVSKIFIYLAYPVYLMSLLFRNLIKYRLDFMQDSMVVCPEEKSLLKWGREFALFPSNEEKITLVR